MTSPPASRRVDQGLFAFYAVVAAIALAGQAGAAVEWLKWWPLTALAAVAAVEFGGIVLSAYGDHRRRLGERAYTARTLSAAVAAGAVAVNWRGHHDHLQGGFFAGMSALGYAVWLLHSAARRRDQLRAAGKLPDTPPAYGLWQWARHPGITRRARALALANAAARLAEVAGKPPGTPPRTPALGLYGSLAAARAAVRTERRQAAISAVLRRKIEAGTDPLTAEIAVTVYDLDEIAARLAAAADYDGLTALIAADLAPDRLADDATVTVTAPASQAPANPSAPAAGDRHGAATEPAMMAGGHPSTGNPDEGRRGGSGDGHHDAGKAATRKPARTARAKPATNAVKVARAATKMPGASVTAIAKKAGVSESTARRHLRSPNGGPVPAEEVAAARPLGDAAVPAAAN